MKLKDIINILCVINGIVDQMNLFVLNVVIEVVCVGEYGCGFFVVVEEVRKLVVQLVDLVKEIEVLIIEIVKEINIFFGMFQFVN